MTIEQIHRHLRERFPERALSFDPLNRQTLVLPAAGVPEVLAALRDDPETRTDYLEFITCADHPPERLSLVYSLFSYLHGHRVILKVELPRENSTVKTVTHLWENADWNEREVYDLFGVFFEGHPDLRRIMMPDDWEGHPLRKDYSHPNLALKPD